MGGEWESETITRVRVGVGGGFRVRFGVEVGRMTIGFHVYLLLELPFILFWVSRLFRVLS